MTTIRRIDWSETDMLGEPCIAISDGTMTYWAGITDLYAAIESFSATYDHNGVPGDVDCVARVYSAAAESIHDYDMHRRFTIPGE